MNNAEQHISDLEDRIMEITQAGQETENQMEKHESNIRDLWDNIKQVNLHIMGILDREEKEKGIENVFEEIMSENFPNIKETDIKIQEAQRAPNKLNPNRTTPRHVIIKMAKVKERILKAAREKQSTNYKGTPIRLSADFSTETLQARREWQDIFKGMKGKKICNLEYSIQQEYHLNYKGK